MKKILFLVVSLSIAVQCAAQKASSKLSGLRMSLRLNQSLLLPKKDSNPLKREGLYMGWNFIGFPRSAEAITRKHLLELKSKAPQHYLLACRRVKEFRWEPNENNPSWAYSRDGRIGLSKRDYAWDGTRGGPLYKMAIIHEIQHCNPDGNENEDGATWAAFYYGMRMGVPRYFIAWSRHLSTSMGYNDEKWTVNCQITKCINDQWIRENKYE